MNKIVIPYKPRKWAQKFHGSTMRWIVLVLHRRAGKTTAILNHLQRDALRVPKSNYAFIAPTYKQAKRIAWDILKDISRGIPGMNWNESELTAIYPNGSKVFLAGSENVDAFRGIALWGGAQDESAQQPPNLFTEVISKALADHLGYWIWAGTPKGKNDFWRTYNAGLKNPEEWTVVYQTIDDTLSNESGEVVENLRTALQDDKRLVSIGKMTNDEFMQEWYNSFEAAIKGAYYAQEVAELRNNMRIMPVGYDKELPVFTVTDLGVGRQLACGFYQASGPFFRMIDFWTGTDDGKEGIPELIKMFDAKPYHYGVHYAPHDVKATDVGTGKTRWEMASSLGVEFEVIPMIPVNEGIEAGKLFFSNLYIDAKKCEFFIDAISQYRSEWDEDKQIFRDKPLHDWTSHAADVHRYAAIVAPEFDNNYFIKPPLHLRADPDDPTDPNAGNDGDWFDKFGLV